MESNRRLRVFPPLPKFGLKRAVPIVDKSEEEEEEDDDESEDTSSSTSEEESSDIETSDSENQSDGKKKKRKKEREKVEIMSISLSNDPLDPPVEFAPLPEFEWVQQLENEIFSNGMISVAEGIADINFSCLEESVEDFVF